MSVEKQLSSSNFLINFLAVREMRMKQVKREDVEECLKIEQEKEKTWKKVMEVLIQAFERHQTDYWRIADEVEDSLFKEFDTEVIVREGINIWQLKSEFNMFIILKCSSICYPLIYDTFNGTEICTKKTTAVMLKEIQLSTSNSRIFWGLLWCSE